MIYFTRITVYNYVPFSVDPAAYANLSDNEDLNAALAPFVDRNLEAQQSALADLTSDDSEQEVKFYVLINHLK